MLTIPGRTSRYCDGVTRRGFLRIGGLGVGGLALPQLLRAEADSGSRNPQKSVIMIFLPGGPPHQDMIDLKPDAPAEIRGEFKPIKTNVPGLEICELMPRLARMADKYTIIRSVVGANSGHDARQCLSGRTYRVTPPGGWPSIGSVLSRLEGRAEAPVPSYVSLSPRLKTRSWEPGDPGFLGVSHAPFKPNNDGRTDMVLEGATLERLADRRALLKAFDRFRRDTDTSGLMEGLDTFTQQAFGVLTSGRLVEALDLEREDPRLRERYGKGDPTHRLDGGPRLMEHFLIARRLVEAGARCVTLTFGHWDTHANNFGVLREDLPRLDQGVSALIEDLHQRGLDKDVSVVVWGEFGRTPLINKDRGRDHWSRLNWALLAGGGMKSGQVIGATDRLGGEATDRPVRFGEIFATLYQNLGIDVRNTTIRDLHGRPHYLVEEGCHAMRELV